MATRSNLSTKILDSMEEWGSSEHDPASIAEIAGELEVEGMEVFNALNKLEDAGKVTGIGRGLDSKWFLGKSEEIKEETPASTPADRVKRRRRTKVEMEAAKAEARERLEYNTRVAQSQEPGSQHLHPMEDTHPVIPAETPVIAENGETVTIPVDFDDPSKGRRELDAAKGERVLSENTYRSTSKVHFLPETTAERVAPELTELFTDAPQTAEAVQALIRKLQSLLPQEETEGFSVVFHECKNGPALDDVEIPALPAGVSPNVWELAYTANTESAREHWKNVASAEESAYANR